VKTAALLFAAVLPLAAGDAVVLHNGFRLDAERVERCEGRVRLHTAAGVVELEAAAVAFIEQAPPAPVLAAPEPVVATVQPEPENPRQLLDAAADRWGLPREFVHSVAAVESGARQSAVSPKGALGVMQLMPATAARLGADPHDTRQNIDAGVRLLRDLLLQYQHTDRPVSRALAAYNAGAGAVARYRGVPPYRETTSYIDRILERYWKQVRLSGAR
jgi:soluble lytic murein transglycosylase-like protein